MRQQRDQIREVRQDEIRMVKRGQIIPGSEEFTQWNMGPDWWLRYVVQVQVANKEGMGRCPEVAGSSARGQQTGEGRGG